jgi:hypothetical protein
MTRFYSLLTRTVGFQCRTGLTFAVCFSLFSLFACGQDQAPAQKTALLIEKLQAAKAIDAENFADSHTDSTQAVDSIYQAQKAQIVIGQLKRGEEVPQPEIDAALNVPPESISADAKLELTRELKTAEDRDELGEQTHGPGNDWLAWDSYRQQRDRADSIVKALESGEEVPWSEIQNALRVPEEP